MTFKNKISGLIDKSLGKRKTLHQKWLLGVHSKQGFSLLKDDDFWGIFGADMVF